MSKAIGFRKFTLFVIFYLFASLTVYLAISFSSPTWIIAFFTLLPFYGICLISISWVTLKNRNAKVKYFKVLLLPILVLQILKILFSPASCYGWNQGKSCYSLIQSIFSTEDLRTFSSTPPHWEIVESLFPIVLVLYIISLATFLLLIQIQKNPTVP